MNQYIILFGANNDVFGPVDAPDKEDAIAQYLAFNSEDEDAMDDINHVYILTEV